MTKFSESYWRAVAAPRIAGVIAAHAGQPEDTVRIALRRALPEAMPVGIWVSEIDAALGGKPAPAKQGPQQGGLFG